MSSTNDATTPRSLITNLIGRGNDIISMNRALAAAVRAQQQNEASLGPGELDRALREGRVTITVRPPDNR